MKILLTPAPDEESPWNRGSFPPLGILYLAAGLRKLPGLQVQVIDINAESRTLDESVSKVLSCKPDMLGVSVTSGNILEARDYLVKIKTANPTITTVCGGIHPTLFDELMLKELPQVDFILRGEGDHSFPELCRRLSKGRSLKNLPGLSYRSNGNILRGEPQYIEDLNSLPSIDRTLLNPNLYGTRWYGWKLPQLMGKVTTAFTSKGCPFNCTFCSMVALCKRRFRARSAENVYQELGQIADQGFKLVIFFDDNFTVQQDRVGKLCELLLRHPLGLRFGFAGTLHLLPQSLLNLMQEAGFDLVFVGVESGSEKMLATYQKPAQAEAIADGVVRAKKANMFTIASFITGAPEETEDDFRKTLEFIEEIRPHVCDINPLMIHPGSPIWENIKGTEDPPKLEGSRSRPIWRFLSTVTADVVEKRKDKFRNAFFQTYRGVLGVRFARIIEALMLLIHNKTLQQALKLALKDSKIMSQFRSAPGNRN